MRYGVALQECVEPTYDATLRALDAFAERSRMPDVVPIWCREWAAERRLFHAVRERGSEPVAFVETASPWVDESVLRLFACRVGDGTPVRLNQEMDGDWDAPWQAEGWHPPMYAEWFSRSREILRSEADIRVWWCPSIPKRAHEAGYWPGEADLVGFDRYIWDEAHWPQERFDGPIRQCEDIAPGVPVWIGEHGSLAGIPKRAERLRDVARVEGVDVVVLMNLLAERPDGGADDWRWTPAMDKAFKRMVTGG